MMFVDFDDVFKPSPEKMAYYIDMANADIQHNLDLYGEKCINCAHYRSDNLQGYPINEHCDATKLPINNPTSAVCCDYKFMGFIKNKYKKSIDKED